MISIWCTAVGLLAQSVTWSGWSSGFGTTSVNNLVTMTAGHSVIGNVLLANLPQLILSFVYLFYNNLITCMLLSAEYTGFAKTRQSLRVSKPAGTQRSTYYLQLPYKYSITLLVVCALLHWLVSRSLFLVKIDIYNMAGDLDPSRAVTACGYSSTPFALDVVIGSLMIAALFGLARFRKFDEGIPITSSCSLAISAACHPNDPDDANVLLPLQYGVVGVRSSLPTSSVERGHASFSSKEVTPLMDGHVYE